MNTHVCPYRCTYAHHKNTPQGDTVSMCRCYMCSILGAEYRVLCEFQRSKFRTRTQNFPIPLFPLPLPAITVYCTMWMIGDGTYLLLNNQHIAAPVFSYILAVVNGLSRYVFNGRCFNWLALGDSFPWSRVFIMKCWKRQWLMWLTACGSIILQNDKL